MPLNAFERANFREHFHSSEQIIDPETEEPIQPGGLSEEDIQVLIDDAIEAGNFAPSPTRIEYTLSADINIDAAVGTYVDGPSGTPAAGTYDCEVIATIAAAGTNTQPYTGRLLVGATVIDERDLPAGSHPGGGNPTVGHLNARITVDGATVVKASFTKGVGDGVLKRDPVWAGTHSNLHRATIIILTKVG